MHSPEELKALAEEALGAPVEQVMPAALAIELVHTFSLVHDDLPSMDGDEERRGHPSTWKKFGEGVGVLAGDALLGELSDLAKAVEDELTRAQRAEREAPPAKPATPSGEDRPAFGGPGEADAQS